MVMQLVTLTDCHRQKRFVYDNEAAQTIKRDWMLFARAKPFWRKKAKKRQILSGFLLFSRKAKCVEKTEFQNLASKSKIRNLVDNFLSRTIRVERELLIQNNRTGLFSLRSKVKLELYYSKQKQRLHFATGTFFAFISGYLVNVNKSDAIYHPP